MLVLYCPQARAIKNFIMKNKEPKRFLSVRLTPAEFKEAHGITNPLNAIA
jgi:hypothetical protein